MQRLLRRHPRQEVMSDPVIHVQDIPPVQKYDDYTDADNASIQGEMGQFRGLRATRKSRKKVLLKVFRRWLITVAIIVAVYALLVIFSTIPVMSNTTKRLFNSTITGLLILLGLATASSLDGMVADLRWWILSQRHRSKRKVEHILMADRLKELVLLAAKSRRYSIHAAVFFWVLLNIAAQVGLAAIGLCYSVDTSDKHALLSPGNVSVADVSSIQTSKVLSSNSQSLLAQQFTASSYGLISLAFDFKPMELSPKPGDIYHPADPLTYCGVDYCQYVFHDTSTISTSDEIAPMAVYTSRTMNSSATCNSWAVTKGGNGTEDTITIAGDTGDSDFYIPVHGGVDQTTFMTNTLLDCGPGCSIVAAFEASASSPWFYMCNVTVRPVANATRPEHQAGASLLSLASAGIALQGYAASSLVDDIAFQFQVYPAESVFGFPMKGDNESMASTMARCAIGVVAIAALYNDGLIIEDTAPMAGVTLNVTHWNYVYLILILTASIQLALALVMALVAHQVVVPPNNSTALVQVLRQMGARDRSQDYAGSDEKDNSEDLPLSSLWIYRDTLVSKDGVYDLYMEEACSNIKESLGTMDKEAATE